MGLDLKLLPQHSLSADFSHDIISFSREYSLFEIIQETEKKYGIQVQVDRLTTYLGDATTDEGGRGYGYTNETPYGEPLKGVYAKHLKGEIEGYKSTSWRNRAIIAFINELPDGVLIWLFWD